MKKKILLCLIAITSIFVITGCTKDEATTETKSGYKTYECRYSKEDNAEGKRYLTRYIVELNSKNEAEVYTLISGFSNYGSETDEYKEFCDGLKDNKQTDLLEKYKDAVSFEVVCDSKNNYEAYALKKYQVKKIKDIDDFSSVYKSIKKYIKASGTFDLEAWKDYFNTDSLKAGNYSCDF